MKLESLAPLPPTLDLGHCLLRALRPGDAPSWYAYLSDPKVTALTSYDIRSVEEVAGMIEHYICGYLQRSSSRWALGHKHSDILVWTCGHYWWDTRHSVAELGYDLTRELWGQGLMTLAVETVVSWGFEHLELNRIQATVMVGNVASARVLEKCGFHREGTLREYGVKGGKLFRLQSNGAGRDDVMYGNLRVVHYNSVDNELQHFLLRLERRLHQRPAHALAELIETGKQSHLLLPIRSLPADL